MEVRIFYLTIEPEKNHYNGISKFRKILQCYLNASRIFSFETLDEKETRGNFSLCSLGFAPVRCVEREREH